MAEDPGKALGVAMSRPTLDALFVGGTAKLGLATTDTISFYGVSPVAQRSGATQVAVSATVVNASAANGSATWGFASSTQANQVVTLLNELRAALVALGAIAGS